MTIEALHSFVDFLSSRDPASPGFVGPLPNSSRDLGGEIHVAGGLRRAPKRDCASDHGPLCVPTEHPVPPCGDLYEGHHD